MTKPNPFQTPPFAARADTIASADAPSAWIDRPLLATMLPAVLSLILSLIPFLAGHVPRPMVHDEFSYLLAADTFAHGRLTNPPLPEWQFFEAMHVLMQPTYASKFLPGQGLILAGGEMLGWPIFGCYLIAAAACAAIAWLLLARLPGRWALLGGCLAAVHPLLMWWSQSYWGGGVPLLGGALLTGSALRLARFEGVRASWLWLAGIGSGLLLISRPFEGGIVGLLLAGALLVIAWRQRDFRPILRSIPIVGGITLFTAAWLAYYAYRVTGSPWQLPYTLAARQYMASPLMFWQAIPPTPPYDHPFLERFYHQSEWLEFAAQLTWPGYFHQSLLKLKYLADAYFRTLWLLAVPILPALWLTRHDRVTRLAALIVFGLPLIHLICTPWLRSHYMAPATGGLFFLITLGLQRLTRWNWRGLRLGVFTITLLIAALLVRTTATELGFFHPPGSDPLTPVYARLDALERTNAGHKLIFVHHLAESSMSDLVYNSADLDAQSVIFARDRGSVEDRRLLKAYPDREPWLLTIESAELKPFSRSESSVPATP